MTVNEMIPAFEAILFASGEPVETERFCEQFEIDMETAENVMDMLADRLDINLQPEKSLEIQLELRLICAEKLRFLRQL